MVLLDGKLHTILILKFWLYCRGPGKERVAVWRIRRMRCTETKEDHRPWGKEDRGRV